MVLLIFKAGLRAIEIACLDLGKPARGRYGARARQTKGGKPRTVTVGKELREACKPTAPSASTLADGDRVFRARHAKPGEPLSANAVAAWFRDLYVRRLGWDRL